jgi:hypothetical protein
VAAMAPEKCLQQARIRKTSRSMGSAGGRKEHNWPLVLAGRCQEWLLVCRPSPLPEPLLRLSA